MDSGPCMHILLLVPPSPPQDMGDAPPSSLTPSSRHWDAPPSLPQDMGDTPPYSLPPPQDMGTLLPPPPSHRHQDMGDAPPNSLTPPQDMGTPPPSSPQDMGDTPPQDMGIPLLLPHLGYTVCGPWMDYIPRPRKTWGIPLPPSSPPQDMGDTLITLPTPSPLLKTWGYPSSLAPSRHGECPSLLPRPPRHWRYPSLLPCPLLKTWGMPLHSFPLSPQDMGRAPPPPLLPLLLTAWEMFLDIRLNLWPWESSFPTSSCGMCHISRQRKVVFTHLLFLFLSPALRHACSGPVEEFWWDVCCTSCQLPVWRLHATWIRRGWILSTRLGIR